MGKALPLRGRGRVGFDRHNRPGAGKRHVEDGRGGVGKYCGGGDGGAAGLLYRAGAGGEPEYRRFTGARWQEGALLLHNPFAAVSGSMILTALGGADGCDCDRGGFLCGSWGGGTLAPFPTPVLR